MIKSLAKEYIDNPDKIPEEYITQGYNFAKEYADANDIKLMSYIKDPDNIVVISEAIHKELPFKVRVFVSKTLISDALTQNHDWIIKKFKELEKTEKKKKTI